jgi:hypothetical protein
VRLDSNPTVFIIIRGADRETNVARKVAPRAATKDVPTATVCRPSLAVSGCALIVVVPAVLHPFLDISQHVVQAESVGRETASGGYLFIPLGPTSIAVGVALADPVSPIPSLFDAGT